MKSFHIVLTGHKLGEELGKKNIEIAKSFGLDAKLFPGIPGNDCKHIFVEHKIRNGFRGINAIGQRGCFLSHFLLWKKCVELNEPIAILEHDGVFLRSIPADIEQHFTDVCRLESFKHWDPAYETQTAASLGKNVTFEKLDSEFYDPLTGTFYVGYYGYLIKPCGAQKLINHAKKIGAIPVDMFVGANVVDIISVTASIVRLDEVYIGRVTELSTTYNFNNALNG